MEIFTAKKCDFFFSKHFSGFSLAFSPLFSNAVAHIESNGKRSSHASDLQVIYYLLYPFCSIAWVIYRSACVL